MTSCGLNGGPLVTEGIYPAGIACNLTNGHMPSAKKDPFEETIPNISNDGNERFITEITDGTMIGYKYFAFNGDVQLSLSVRGNATGELVISTEDGVLERTQIESSCLWNNVTIKLSTSGKKSLFIKYHGEGMLDLMSISLNKKVEFQIFGGLKMQAIKLRTEHMKNPLGIDVRKPFLSWICENGITQTAYELSASSDGLEIWNSGIVKNRCYACCIGRKLEK